MKRSLELVGQQDPGLAENAGDGGSRKDGDIQGQPRLQKSQPLCLHGCLSPENYDTSNKNLKPKQRKGR